MKLPNIHPHSHLRRLRVGTGVAAASLLFPHGASAQSTSAPSSGADSSGEVRPADTRPSDPQNATTTAETPEDDTPSPGLFGGVDLYAGVSNREGLKRFRDGFWNSGSGLAYPSTVYLRWQSARGASAKVLLGVGKMTIGDYDVFDNPVEAWYQQPHGDFTFTAGKYFVPFAVQEWEYETKPGVMVQWTKDANSVALSANHNHNTDAGNFYLRAGRDINENLNIGLSAAAGRGISYDSIHDRGYSIDATAKWRDFTLLGEYVEFRRRSSDKFRFGSARVTYGKLGRLTPFVDYYRWKDQSDEFGNYRTTSLGADYEVRPGFVVNGGYAFASDKNTIWAQIHYSWESRSLR